MVIDLDRYADQFFELRPFEAAVEDLIISADYDDREAAVGAAEAQLRDLNIEGIYGPLFSALIAVHLIAQIGANR